MRRFVPGVAVVLLGVGVYVVQMFVGLNDESEYSNPSYLEAARWVAFALSVGGALWIAGGVLSIRSAGERK